MHYGLNGGPVRLPDQIISCAMQRAKIKHPSNKIPLENHVVGSFLRRFRDKPSSKFPYAQ
jgi:hypothetical protein